MTVEIGSIVRVDLNGRRVRGWVVELDSTPPAGKRLLPLRKVTGRGPSAELIELSEWAVSRWTGRRSFYLGTASPERVVSGLPPRFERAVSELPTPAGVRIVSPDFDPLAAVEEAHWAGPSLVIVPARRSAQRLVEALQRRGNKGVVLHPDGWAQAAAGGVTVIGTRAAAWCPMPVMSAVVVIDAHDEAHQSEASPTWNAIDVVTERAARSGARVALITPVPRLALLHSREVTVEEQRNGWAATHVIDMRKSDPHSGRYSHQLTAALRSDKRVVCVLNRKGRAQLLVCSACQDVATCARCASSMRSVETGQLECRRCNATQPAICRNCGSSKLKQLRAGVTKVREELEALALRPVGEVTAETKELPAAHVLVGTEAVLHRVGRADVVVFLEFDQELLASRYRAAEDALVLLARASRIVGGRKRDGVVMVQTRMPESEVIEAAVNADPMRLYEVEKVRRKELGWPPFSAIARLSGAGASDFVDELDSSLAKFGPDDDGVWLVRATTLEQLGAALCQAKRPKERVRIEVDPARL